MNGGVLINLARRIVVNNFFLKFIAVVLALSLYIWVSEDRETVVAGFAPIQLVVPDGLILVSDPIDRVKITFRGRWSDINRFDPSNLDPIRIDLSADDADNVVSINSDRVAVPPTIRVTDIEPDSLYVNLEQERQKTVPVRPRLTGDPRASYTIDEVRVDPETVTIRGPASRLETIDSVPTERLDISDQTESIRRPLRLAISDGLVTADVDGPIELTIEITTEEVTQSVENIPVDAVNTSYDTTVEPDSVTLTVRGPESVVNNMDRDLIRAEIDLEQEDGRPPGRYSRTADVVNLPPHVELLQTHPERFRVITANRPEPEVDDEASDPEGTDSL